MDQKVSSEIKITYWNYIINEKYYDGKIHKQPEDLYIENYAELKNSHAFMMCGDDLQYTADINYIVTAGYSIELGSSQHIYIFNNGKLYLVEEAYEKGIIDKEDVYEIGTVFNSTFKDRYPEQ